MIQSITQDNLIRYMYRETGPEEASLIEEAIQSDWELKELYETLMESKSELDRIRLKPSKTVIDSIMSYSKNSAPMEHLS